MPKISDAKILILSTDGFEQSELLTPLEELKAAGATVHVATPDAKSITGWTDGDWGETVEADLDLAQADYGAYDALVLPGGQINPDVLRTNETAVKLVREFVTGNKIVAAICHAPWLLIEAEVIRGRDATSYGSIRTDMVNAGANWMDCEVAISNGIITSRSPEDLEAFIAKIIEEVEEGEHQRPAA